MVYKTNDSMLPWVCSEIDHRGRQNVVDLLNILQTWLECTFFYIYRMLGNSSTNSTVSNRCVRFV